MSSTLDAYYDECAEAIWEHDGLLTKQSVMPSWRYSIFRSNKVTIQHKRFVLLVRCSVSLARPTCRACKEFWLS
jgi:hypothetical protein